MRGPTRTHGCPRVDPQVERVGQDFSSIGGLRAVCGPSCSHKKKKNGLKQGFSSVPRREDLPSAPIRLLFGSRTTSLDITAAHTFSPRVAERAGCWFGHCSAGRVKVRRVTGGAGDENSRPAHHYYRCTVIRMEMTFCSMILCAPTLIDLFGQYLISCLFMRSQKILSIIFATRNDFSYLAERAKKRFCWGHTYRPISTHSLHGIPRNFFPVIQDILKIQNQQSFVLLQLLFYKEHIECNLAERGKKRFWWGHNYRPNSKLSLHGILWNLFSVIQDTLRIHNHQSFALLQLVLYKEQVKHFM